MRYGAFTIVNRQILHLFWRLHWIMNLSHETKANEGKSMEQSGTATETIVFDKRGCEALLRKHPGLRHRVAQAVAAQLRHGLFKSKFATTARWQGLPIWECRVNEKSTGAVRAAFTAQGNGATVVYLSPTLQKRAFGAELDRFLERRRP